MNICTFLVSVAIFLIPFLEASFTQANFINTRNAVNVVQPYYTNAHNFLPYLYSRKGENIALRLIGEVRSDVVFSSRQFQTINSGDIFSLWPVQNIDTILGGSGTAQQMFSIGDLLIRLGGYARIPYKNGWILNGCMTGDFNGTFTGAGFFIVKNAYADFNSSSVRLLVGQYINPLAIYDNLPHMVSYTRGAPFLPAAVNPQVLCSYRKNRLYVQGCLYSQFLFFDSGPEKTIVNDYTGFSRSYFNNALSPLVNIRLGYESNEFECGIGFNYKRLVPEIIARRYDLSLTDHPSYSSVNNYVGMAYYMFRSPVLSSKGQLFYGAGTGSEYLMLGGYGLAYREPINNNGVFAKLPFISSWIEFEKTYPTNGIQPGLFIGFIHQFGSGLQPLHMTTTNVVTDPERPPIYFSYPEVYAEQHLEIDTFLQKMLSSLLSVSPRVWIYFAEGLQVGLELNFYRASYGYLNNRAETVNDPNTMNALRTLMSMQYFF